MKTCIDTSIVIALRNPDEEHNRGASEVLGRAYREGALHIHPVVYTELAAYPYIENGEELDAFLDDTGIRVSSPKRETLFRAGTAFAEYLDNRGNQLQCTVCGHETTFDCPRCGETVSARQHVPADFQIGAQAEQEADRLATFDEGFFSTYFDVETLSLKT